MLLKWLKALADETRLRVFHLLLKRELNVNEIMSILDMGQSRISRHLKILTDSGLIRYRRDGLWVFYSLSETRETKDFVTMIQNYFTVGNMFAQDEAQALSLLEKRSRDTVSFFDSVAEHYDAMKRDIFGNVDINSLIAESLTDTTVAADLGCGGGALLDTLLTHSQQVIGIDSSTKMLESARRLIGKDGSRVDLRIGQLEHLPMRDQEADTAIIAMVLHHLNDPQKGLLEAFRVLKPSGRLIVADFKKHSNELLRDRYGDRWLGFENSDILKWLKASSLSIVENKSIPLGQGMEVFLIVAEKND